MLRVNEQTRSVRQTLENEGMLVLTLSMAYGTSGISFQAEPADREWFAAHPEESAEAVRAFLTEMNPLLAEEGLPIIRCS